MTIQGHRHREQEYGYLSYYPYIVLGLERGREPSTHRHRRAHHMWAHHTLPFFQPRAGRQLFKRSSRRRLVQAFLHTWVPFPVPDAERTWHEEARFAAPAELPMCLRWGLARILCVSGGNAMRGLLSWDAYVEWSEAELRAW